MQKNYQHLLRPCAIFVERLNDSFIPSKRYKVDADIIYRSTHEQQQQQSTNKLFSNENKLVYTKKIDSSRALVAVAKYIFQNRPYNFTDENDVFSYLINNSDVKKVNQKVESKMNFAGAKLSYVKKYENDKSFQIQLGNKYE